MRREMRKATEKLEETSVQETIHNTLKVGLPGVIVLWYMYMAVLCCFMCVFSKKLIRTCVALILSR